MSHWEAAGKSDEWFTPPHVFSALGCRFDLDVAAPKKQTTCVPATHFLTDKSLGAQWTGFVWMNPPYGKRNEVEEWLDKFFRHGHGIALTPDRTSAPWFQKSWTKASAVLFTPKLKFLRPDGTIGKSPSNGTALWAAGEKASRALEHARRAGLGVLAFPG